MCQTSDPHPGGSVALPGPGKKEPIAPVENTRTRPARKIGHYKYTEEALLHAMVRDFDYFGLAVGVGDIAMGDVGVGVWVGEDGIFELIDDGVVEAKDAPFRFRESQMVGFFFFHGLELRGEVAEIEFDAAGCFAEGEQFNDDGFLIVSQPEEALHGVVLGSHPFLLGGERPESALPAAGE